MQRDAGAEVVVVMRPRGADLDGLQQGGAVRRADLRMRSGDHPAGGGQAAAGAAFRLQPGIDLEKIAVVITGMAAQRAAEAEEAEGRIEGAATVIRRGGRVAG